jgi:hypothetical protein
MKDSLDDYPDITDHHLQSYTIDQGRQLQDSQVYFPTACHNTSFHTSLCPLYPPPTSRGQDICPQSQEQSSDLLTASYPVPPAQNATTFYFADCEQTQLIRPGMLVPQSRFSDTGDCDMSLYGSDTRSRSPFTQWELSTQDPAFLTGSPYESDTATNVNLEDLKLMYVVDSHIFSVSLDSIGSCALFQHEQRNTTQQDTVGGLRRWDKHSRKWLDENHLTGREAGLLEAVQAALIDGKDSFKYKAATGYCARCPKNSSHLVSRDRSTKKGFFCRHCRNNGRPNSKRRRKQHEVMVALTVTGSDGSHDVESHLSSDNREEPSDSPQSGGIDNALYSRPILPTPLAAATSNSLSEYTAPAFYGPRVASQTHLPSVPEHLVLRSTEHVPQDFYPLEARFDIHSTNWFLDAVEEVHRQDFLKIVEDSSHTGQPFEHKRMRLQCTPCSNSGCNLLILRQCRRRREIRIPQRCDQCRRDEKDEERAKGKLLKMRRTSA